MRNAAGRRKSNEMKHTGLVIKEAWYGNIQAKSDYERHQGKQQVAEPSAGSQHDGTGRRKWPQAEPSSQDDKADFENRDSAAGDSEGINLWVGADEGAPAPWVDVTIPTQFMVDSSALLLHNGISKRGLMGFCDPCPGEEKTLHVIYSYRVFSSQSRPKCCSATVN